MDDRDFYDEEEDEEEEEEGILAGEGIVYVPKNENK